jgi:hypothetical protein
MSSRHSFPKSISNSLVKEVVIFKIWQNKQNSFSNSLVKEAAIFPKLPNILSARVCQLLSLVRGRRFPSRACGEKSSSRSRATEDNLSSRSRADRAHVVSRSAVPRPALSSRIQSTPSPRPRLGGVQIPQKILGGRCCPRQ